MKQEELNKIIKLHKKWLNNEPGGIRANLSNQDLSGLDMYCAIMIYADMRCADMTGANMISAIMTGANISGANMSGADMSGANMTGAIMSGADMTGAKNIPQHVIDMTRVVPDSGDVIGWKKCKDDVIVKLLIPSDAKRSNATSKKCRASFVKVMKVFGAEKGISKHDGKTTYIKDEIVRCDKWNEDRFNECSGGIHFFMSRKEAEDY